MAVDERRGSVVFAEQAAVNVVKPIPGDQLVPAGGTRETLRGEGGRDGRESITTTPIRWRSALLRKQEVKKPELAG